MFEITKSHLQVKNLSQWLCYLETIHTVEIDLGLERIKQVAKRLAIDLSFAQVITVAGTNGKGTTCAFLENALLGEQKNVAVYSSPHIEKFNERLRFNKVDIDDQSLILAFEQIESIRAEISLTYYEYTTLAAFLVLMAQQPDVIILEVGLGGRLDATNLIDANIMVLTTIDIDHQRFLGNDRETIGFEKAGIMRANSPVILGDHNPPTSVLSYAQLIGAKVLVRKQHFDASLNNNCWCWHDHQNKFSNLILPYIPLDNVATALMVLTELGIELNSVKINAWLKATKVAGRMELFAGQQGGDQCDVILDVGHNPQAARFLAQQLQSGHYQKVSAVFAIMADKDILQVLEPLAAIVDNWYIGNLAIARAATTAQITDCLVQLNQHYHCFDNVTQAYKMACSETKEKELLLVFGSFFTVAEIRALLVK